MIFNGRAIRVAGLMALVLMGSFDFAVAQSGDAKAGEPSKQVQSDPTKDSQRKIDEFTEAAKSLQGPAGNPECVWIGRRMVSLMWRDDLDTAFRHLDLYDRFGCPGGHIQATFRCLVRFGSLDPKQSDTLHARIHSCWINPGAQPPLNPTVAPPPATAAPSSSAPAK